MADPAQQAAALAFMKHAARDAFGLSAKTAEEMAENIKSGKLPINGETACMLLASMFRASAKRD